jgi:hypothetical protein
MSRPTPADVADRFLRLLSDEGLPPPDEVEYGADELVFLYRDRKLAVVVELSDEAEPADDDAAPRRRDAELLGDEP